MDTAVLAGTLDLPHYDRERREYLRCDWLPPKWDWIDPLKDARAEIEQIEAGLKSRSQALAERGYDAEQVDSQIAADKERETSLGLVFGTMATANINQAPSAQGLANGSEEALARRD
jgi:capsid protein